MCTERFYIVCYKDIVHYDVFLTLHLSLGEVAQWLFAIQIDLYHSETNAAKIPPTTNTSTTYGSMRPVTILTPLNPTHNATQMSRNAPA